VNAVYFGGGALLGIVGWLTVFAALIWPRLGRQPMTEQLKFLTAIHFFRYFGTTMLMVGLVSRKLPSGFAYPAAYGDLLSVALAYVAFAGLRRSGAGKPTTFALWLFNIVGAADLLLAMVMGPALIRDPADLGVAYIIPTVYVPLLLTAHFYALRALARRSADASALLSRGPSLTTSDGT
jgi:hypothetical protein